MKVYWYMQKEEVTLKSKKPNRQQFINKKPHHLLLEEFRDSTRPTLLPTKNVTLVSEDLALGPAS